MPRITTEARNIAETPSTTNQLYLAVEDMVHF